VCHHCGMTTPSHPAATNGLILMGDPRVTAIPVTGNGEDLHAAGLVNYPTEWWHWSYGDRYWAMATGAPAAIYGPVS